MAFLRKRGQKYSLSFKWKHRSYIRALGTTSEREARQIKKDAEAQLDRIRRGQSPAASKFLAGGFSIVDILFDSPDVAARLRLQPENKPRRPARSARTQKQSESGQCRACPRRTNAESPDRITGCCRVLIGS